MRNIAVTFRHSCLPVFAWRRIVLRFSTRNNCCKFLAFYGVFTQSVLQSFMKMPVCGASLSHFLWLLITLNCLINSIHPYNLPCLMILRHMAMQDYYRVERIIMKGSLQRGRNMNKILCFDLDYSPFQQAFYSLFTAPNETLIWDSILHAKSDSRKFS